MTSGRVRAALPGESSDGAAHPLESARALAPRRRSIVARRARSGLTGELSGRLFGGVVAARRASPRWARCSRASRATPAIPADAWPAPARALHPGPGRLLRHLRRRSSSRSSRSRAAAHRAPARSTAIGRRRGALGAPTRSSRCFASADREPGRLILGRADGRLVAAEPRQSVIVVGPTQTGKTTGFAIPAILEWQGPGRRDVDQDRPPPRDDRRALGDRRRAHVSSTTRPAAPAFRAPAGRRSSECLTWQGAQRVAEWLVRGARPGALGSSDAADFWYGATAKLLAPILLAAACSGGSMAQVVAWIDSQETDARHATRSSERRARRRSTRSRRSRSGTTGPEAASTRPRRPCSIAYADPGVLTSAMTSELRAERLLDGGWHTAYLCAPAHEQRRLQPLFATLVQEIVAHAYDRTTETGKPLDPPLLLVLDECANIAPLRDLATLASTGAGQGIQLVSVFQDMAQIYAVYGRDRAPTIVSNHRAKVILSGIADPQTLEYVAPAARRRGGAAHVVDLERRTGHSTTESVSLPPPRARERPARDAARPRRPRLRPPRAGADRAAALVQGSPAPPAREAAQLAVSEAALP